MGGTEDSSSHIPGTFVMGSSDQHILRFSLINQESFVDLKSRLPCTEICFLWNVTPIFLLDRCLLCVRIISHQGIALQWITVNSFVSFQGQCTVNKIESPTSFSLNLVGSHSCSLNSMHMLKGKPTLMLQTTLQSAVCSLDNFICEFWLQGLWTVLNVFFVISFTFPTSEITQQKLVKAFL